eukprot:1331578-Prymnesium_polylepis.1
MLSTGDPSVVGAALPVVGGDSPVESAALGPAASTAATKSPLSVQVAVSIPRSWQSALSSLMDLVRSEASSSTAIEAVVASAGTAAAGVSTGAAAGASTAYTYTCAFSGTSASTSANVSTPPFSK